MNDASGLRTASDFLAGGGKMGALMRGFDWPNSPLGSPQAWPQALRTLVDVMLAANQPMFIAWGPERTLLYNDPYASLLGQKHPAALGRPLLDAWSEIREELKPLVDRVFAGTSVQMDDITFILDRHGRPEEAHFAFSYTPVRDEQGAVAGLFCACLEITGQVLADRQAAAEQIRLKQMFAQAPASMALLRGPDHVFELANPAYMQLIGHRDVIGKPLREALPEVVGQGFVGLLDEVYRTGNAFVGRSVKVRLQRRPGGQTEDRLLDFVYQPLTDTDGRVTGIFAQATDVTDRAQAETRLREHGMRNRQILDSAVDYAIISSDLEGRITSWNEGARRTLGWAEEEMLGETAHPFFTPEDVAAGRPETEMRCALIDGRASDERWHVRKTGERFWALGEMMPLRDEAGVAVGFVKVMRDRTVEQMSEQALLESEARLRVSEESLRLATEAAEIGTWDLDLESDVLTWSDRTKAMFGISPGRECSMADFYAGLHPDDLETTRAAFASALDPAKRATYDVEYRTIGQEDGVVRWVAAKGRGLFDEAGHCIRAVGTAIDITQRKAAEQRLRESEARLAESEAKFRAITDSIDQMIWSTRPDGFHDFFNQRWYDYTGVPQGSTDGDGWNGIFHPDDQERAWARWRHSLATGELYEIEYRLRHRSGQYRWVLGRAVPLRDQQDRIVRWFGTCTDIQEIVEARDVLARSREVLEREVAERTRERDRVWQNSRDLLVVVGSDGVFRAVSPSWSRILGHAFEDVVGRSFHDFIWPDDAQLTQVRHDQAAGKRDLTDFENRYKHKDGSFRWISWHTSTEGDLVYAYGRDVTAEKEAAAQLEQAQEALRQASKMEAVGQLTGGIAHDFNNLLTGVIGSLDMLQRRISQGRTGEIERYATAAMSSASRAAALTHRLLAFSRRQPLDPKPVSANRLVTGMEELLRRTIGETIRLEIVTAGGLWLTLCDPHQLENAILNLAINARDAMPEGGTLTIETCNAHLDNTYAAKSRDVRPGQYVCICVTDTGTGMSADVIAKAFDPFFTTKPIGRGTGLGLSMIYGFARQSDGYAKIYSEVGEGTTVKLYLPRYYGEAEDAPEEPARPVDKRRTEQSEVVLVVEDETAVRDLVTDVLEELGYQALEASDGPSGLKLLQSDMRIDLLVTDVGLPGLNGRQLADAGRGLRPELKVLFMTGYAENATIANGFLEPGMEMITKPFAIEALATRIRDMIEAAEDTQTRKRRH